MSAALCSKKAPDIFLPAKQKIKIILRILFHPTWCPDAFLYTAHLSFPVDSSLPSEGRQYSSSKPSAYSYIKQKFEFKKYLFIYFSVKPPYLPPPLPVSALGASPRDPELPSQVHLQPLLGLWAHGAARAPGAAKVVVADPGK